MFPYFILFGHIISTNKILMYISLLLSLLIFQKTLKGSFFKNFLLLSSTALIALIGARLFHVFFERPELLKTPQKIFSNWDGLTFYGSFFLALPFFLLFLNFFYERSLRSKALDIASICTALGYGFLRIGCFANGCCWGRLCPFPWAVTYNNSSGAMPYIGVPVHPVQLYDAALGFFIALILFLFYKKKVFSGHLIAVFGLLYSLGRIFTETFRGDAYRGTDIFGVLSTSQLISISLGLFCLFYLWRISKKHKKVA